MAVWMQVVGEKKTLEDVEAGVKECRKVLAELELSLTFLRGTLEPQTPAQAVYNRLLPGYWSYDKANWIIEERERAIVMYYPLYENTNDRWDSLVISLGQDTLMIRGPFAHFSQYWNVAREEPLRTGYQNLIRGVYTGFRVKEVVYFSEWCYSTDEFETYQELKAFLDTIPERQVTQLEQMQDGQEYYVEAIER